jgi:DNA-binding NarL/FixJ family response regulator
LIRIFIADDHAIVRHGLRQLIDAQPDMRCIGEASDGRQVLLAEGKDQWDVLILDLSLPRVNGIEVLRRLRSELPALRIVALSMYPEEQYAVRLLEEGASAYLSKEYPAEQLLAALRQVAAGRTFMSGKLSEQLQRGERKKGVLPHESLSAREYQIFTLLLVGRTASEVAAELNLSASTVSTHLSHVKEKLGVRNIAEIIDYGHRAGLVKSL